MTSKGAGLLAILIAAAVLWAIPTASSGKSVNLKQAGDALRQVTAGLGEAVDQTLAKTQEELRLARERAKAALAAKKQQQQQGTAVAEKRATATDPSTQPPVHGANPHAQGGVAIVDVDPKNERPLSSDPSGKDSGEDVILGRARGEQNADGTYHGHITILTLLGSELASVDSAPGESKKGPLDAVQTGILDPLCKSTSGQVCLAVLTANSTTTATGSDNDFAVARASVLGLGVGAAESHATIGTQGTCQGATGTSKVANVSAPGGGAVASVSNSSSTSKSCTGQAPQVLNTSSVIGLGGIQVPLPAAGCADGTPDTVSGIPAVLPIVCNADDILGATAVREALDVFVLQVGGTSLAKATTAASESLTVAPAAVPPGETTPKQCSDGKDNDGDKKIDAADPGCHVGGKLSGAYNPEDDDESDDATVGSSGTECSDKVDNDGDGKVDASDPGCHVDNNINKPFNPDDDSEGSDGDGNGPGDNGGNAPSGTGQNAGGGNLPFTGTDVVGLGLAGLLMLAGGLLLRRREDTHAAL
ncbi:MAG TPA: LPXTG cell wall anchor domain-containing protein [Solirubrobacteraceae bacterium]|jgi:LPXTG-motif cell wall-anchored protein|nr:LPXTG cell wall anchor domain-containing protein [Solirubrobacteraceae bacterium]